MKNLIYILSIAVFGLVACGAPAEKNAAEETTETTVTEEVKMDTATVEEVEMEMDTTATEEEVAE
ncbi:MAG: hypothetical protein VX344_04470 [Bacteroidota bacterium]|nr:hypothetical protein [Bacteroidota bacterium]